MLALRWVLVILLIASAGAVAHQTRSLLRRGAQMGRVCPGRDAELAVGQELDQLMREGAAVFHDSSAEKFNSDHVVIALQGVLAVQTKGYSKPNRGVGAAHARVQFQGEALQIPDRLRVEPIEQAVRQAQSLSRWLGSATGEVAAVTRVVALPGWFVARKGRADVLVFNGKELRGQLLKARTAKPRSAHQTRRVVHQVEQRCRNVEPNYRPDADHR